MAMTREEMVKLLPAVRPPEFELADTEQRTFEWLQSRAEDVLEASFLWSRWIPRQFHGPGVPYSGRHSFRSYSVAGSIGAVVGFIPLSDSVPEHQSVGLEARNIGWLFTMAILFEGPEHECRARTMELDSDYHFPLIYLPVRRIEHAPPNVDGATSACWARSNKFLANGDEGVLTAKHAVRGLARGDPVDLDDGDTGTLTDYSDGNVDAALVATDSFPTRTTARDIVDEPINGDDAYFDGAETGSTITGQIMSTWYFPDNPDPYNPMRIFLDEHGKEGDSGALVCDKTSGDALALYVGEISANGQDMGMCQYLRQAVDLLDIEIFN